MKQINSYSISLEEVTELLTFEGRIVFVKMMPSNLSVRMFIESDTDAEQVKRNFRLIITQPYDGKHIATIQGEKSFQIYHLIELTLSVSQSQDGEVSAKAESIDSCVETAINGTSTVNEIEQSTDFYPIEFHPNPSNQHNPLSAAQAKDRFDTIRKAIEP